MDLTTEQLQRIIQEELEGIVAEDCQDGYERVPGSKELAQGSCREKTDEGLNEDDKVKKDACYKKIKGAVKRKGGTWPSAYASGRLVQCRKVGAANWKEGEPKKEGKQSSEDAGRLDKWFKRKGEKGSKGGWVNCNRPDGAGGYKECAREKPSDPKPYCRPTPSACKTEPKQNESRKRVVEVRIVKSNMKEAEITKDEEEELEDVSDQLKGAVKAHGKQADTIDKALKKEQVVNEEELEEKKKKKPCKKAKGKKFVKRVNGKCRSFGQAGKAKDGGPRIRPGTEKGHAFCARTAGIKKCKNPPCANTLSRKKWKCKGKRSEP